MRHRLVQEVKDSTKLIREIDSETRGPSLGLTSPLIRGGYHYQGVGGHRGVHPLCNLASEVERLTDSLARTDSRDISDKVLGFELG